MAFPQIGLEAVLEIDQFEKNAKTYNRTIDQMDKKTRDAGRGITKSTTKAGRDVFGMSEQFRDAVKTNEDAFNAAAQSTQTYTASLDDMVKTAGVTVGALAGVAAGIKAALDLGEEAAAIEDARSSFVALAADSGVSASQLVADLQSVSRGTVTTTDLIKTANSALLAGGAQIADQLPRLFQIAEASARATGQNTDFVFQTLIRGIIKASPLLIDNAEIYVKVGDAVDQYAASLGKTTEELSAQERQVAVLNAVVNDGSKFIDRLGGSTERATDPFRRLSVTFESIKTGISTLLLPLFDRLAVGIEGAATAAKFFTAFGIANIKTVSNLGDILSGTTTFAEQYGETFNEVFQTLDTGTKTVDDLATSISAVGDASVEAAQDVSELDDKVADLAAQRGERLAKIELQNARRDEDIAIQRSRQLEDADRQLARTREDQSKQAAQARADAERDNAKRVREIGEEIAQKERQLVQETQRQREDLERDHQETLFQIRQKAQDTIGEAARRNDAVAIAQALRQRQREIRDEQRDSQTEKTNLERDLQEKRQKLDEDAQLEKEKQQQRFAEQITSLQENQARQEEALQLSLSRQNEDRQLAWDRQNEDLVRARERQLEDLDTWYSKEQEKLKTNLDAQTQIATDGVQKAGVAIAAATTTAINTVAASSVGLSAEQQFQRRGSFLGSEVTPSSIGLSEEEQRRLRGSYLRRAEGGVDVVDRPTKFLAGEAGPEIAAFVPLRNTQHTLDVSGNIGFDNLPQGMNADQAQGLVWAALETLARRLTVRG